MVPTVKGSPQLERLYPKEIKLFRFRDISYYHFGYEFSFLKETSCLKVPVTVGAVV